MQGQTTSFRRRFLVTEETIPFFESGVKLQRDWARRRNVLLAPERVIVLDQTAFEILSRCDGHRRIGAIADELCLEHKAQRQTVSADVCAMLQELFDKRYITQAKGQITSPGHAAAPARHVEAGVEDYPLSVLAELTHRCPLKCPYCSNPLALARPDRELSTGDWKKLIDQVAQMGVLQIHFSGGEPLVRKDLADLVAHASGAGLYTNLITSGVLLDENKMGRLARAGLDHIQISFQGMENSNADKIAGCKGAHAKKLRAAALVRGAGLPLTVNAVMHRQNLHQLSAIIDMSVALDAGRLEVAHVQYMGWALKNRAALIPSREQFEDGARIVEAARKRLNGVLVIDYVMPDYYAVRPKKCMGGWAEQFLNITPSGIVLPCHAAESIAGLTFDSVRQHSLSWIWRQSSAFRKFRGTDWMQEPCKSCAFRENDRGGCRCQAFALTGEAANADPACGFSPFHAKIKALAEAESHRDDRRVSYRSF